MTTEPAARPATDQAGQHLDVIAAALADRGISTRLDCTASTPVLTAVTRPSMPAAATVTIHPDPWTAMALNCTCIWDPAPGTTPEAVAAVAAGILAAAGRPPFPAAPDGADRIAGFLRRHPGWSAFWDKAYGVWRAAEDDPASALYAETPDPRHRHRLHHQPHRRVGRRAG